MKVLEVNCQNCYSFTKIFISKIQLNKSFTCDECEEIILMVDKELLNQIK